MPYDLPDVTGGTGDVTGGTTGDTTGGTPIDKSSKDKQQEFLEDLFARRGIKKAGFNNIRFVELTGGRVIEPTAFEPDPRTYRGEYYYNATNNVLYRKITVRKEPGIVVAYWKKISD